MTRPMLSRVLQELGDESLLDALSERLAPADLASLMLEVYARRTRARDVAAVAEQFADNRFTRPSTVSQREQLEFDRLAYSVLPESFESIELSPLSPSGVCTSLASIHPDKSVATVRNVEVGSDPTNVLALIAAARRKGPVDERPTVRLATSYRAVRPQRVDFPGAWAHFRLFALATAGRSEASHGFELEALREHVRFHVALLAAARDAGFRIRTLQLSLTDFDDDEARAERWLQAIAVPLATEFAALEVRVDPERTRGRGYYHTAGFQLDAVGDDGQTYGIGDGGLTDWTAQLSGDRRERLMISGFGSERLCACLGPG